MSAATAAVTVAKTVPVSSTSALMPAAAAAPSKETPHALSLYCTAVTPLTCKSVLMLVPVVTAAWAAVVGKGPLKILYCGIAGTP